MNTDDGLSFATAVDVSEYDRGMEHIQQSTQSMVSSVEQETSRIQQLLTDAVPEVNLDFLKNETPTLDAIGEAYAQIAKVIRENEEAINELSVAYREATDEANKYANVPSMSDTYKEARTQQAAIKEVIAVRKKAIEAAKQEEAELSKNEKRYVAEAKAAEKSAAAKQKNATASVTLRQQIKALEMEAANMVAAAQAEGRQIDQSTGRYREIIEELGRLKDIRGDIQTAGSVFANDENQFAGVISGLSGVAGAFSAAQGAVGLFAGENEELQQIMLKVQSLMSITIGLQQVQQTLNKDSAFTLVTLNGLKKYWNELLAVGRGEQVAETAATVAGTTASVASAAATEADADATILNAEASTAEAAAKKAKAAASGTAAAAEGVDTAATAANATAAGAGTVANIGLAGAFRMVGAAIKSIPVFGWILAGISALIGVFQLFKSSAAKTDEQLKEHQEFLKDSRKAYAQASGELKAYQSRIESFNGTQQQEASLIKDLNSKYGEQMGYHKTLAEWKDTLATKGESYCKALEKEALAQAYLNKYVEAYINLLEVQDNVKAGKYHHWYQTAAGDKNADKEAQDAAQAEVDRYLKAYEDAMNDAQSIRQTSNLGGFTDPTTSKSGGSSSKSDPAKAALEQKKILDSFTEQMKKYIKDANASVTEEIIDSLADGLGKEITQIRNNASKRKDAIIEGVNQLAAAQKQAAHDVYMTKDGATETGWAASSDGQKSTDDYIKQLLGVSLDSLQSAADDTLTEAGKATRDMLNSLDSQTSRLIREAQDKQYESFVNEFGTTEQKIQQLWVKYTKAINSIPEEIQGLDRQRVMDNILQQYNDAESQLTMGDFKTSIDWESVFGDLSNQSTDTITYNLDMIKSKFEQMRGSLSVTEIKDFQDAIKQMEDEIASRNPFAAFHKSFTDISTSKTELVTALQEFADSQTALKEAQDEYNEALTEQQTIQEQIDNGQLAANSEQAAAATERLSAAEVSLVNAENRGQKAEKNVLKARNNVTNSYKKFATQLKSAGGVVTDLGGKAKNLAAVFSDDIADGMGKALDCIDEVLDAASEVISSIGDVGKSVAKGMTQTVDAMGSATESTAKATATSISTVEKASVILTVISAALQIATAIANLFNSDDSKEKEIEKLQSRIDQLQWELDNADAVRLQENTGNALEKLKSIYAQVTNEVLNLHNVTSQSSIWARYFAKARYSAEIYQKTIEKIADTYAQVSYTADKALGSQKYDESRKQLENLAEQQLLVQKQLDLEESKKKTDSDKVQDYKNELAELAEEMATLINDMVEDIIGTTAEDLASTLGDAFFDAVAQGEDAMEAWADTVNDLVSDIVKKMLVTQYLEPTIGEIFNKYKSSWFGSDGTFKGINAVIESADSLAYDINAVGEEFATVWAGLSSSLGKWFDDDSEREASSKGIATASQDSVDENNARLTTIQGHTYTLVQGVTELNKTSNLMLERLTGIEQNTSTTNDKLDTMNTSVKRVRETLDDISSKGIRVKT